jgi:hypothetical protein
LVKALSGVPDPVVPLLILSSQLLIDWVPVDIDCIYRLNSRATNSKLLNMVFFMVLALIQRIKLSISNRKWLIDSREGVIDTGWQQHALAASAVCAANRVRI